MRDGSIDTDNSFSSAITVDYPKIQIHPLDTKKISFTVWGNQENRQDKVINLYSLTRQSRDLIVLTIRCLGLANYINTSNILQELYNRESLNNPRCSLDLALELEKSVRELNELAYVNRELQLENEKHKKELQCLENELENTIESYKNILIDQADQDTYSNIEKIEQLNKDLEVAHIEKKNLKRQLQEAKDQTSLLKEALETSQAREAEMESIIKHSSQLECDRTEIQRLLSELKLRDEMIESQNSSIEDLTNQFSNKDRECERLKQKCKLQSDELRSMKSKIEKLE